MNDMLFAYGVILIATPIVVVAFWLLYHLLEKIVVWLEGHFKYPKNFIASGFITVLLGYLLILVSKIV